MKNWQNLLQYNSCKVQNNKKPVLKFSAALGLAELLLFTRVLFLSFEELIRLDIHLSEKQHYLRKATLDFCSYCV